MTSRGSVWMGVAWLACAVLAGCDADGVGLFMWLGTEDGLNRFDGFSFQRPVAGEGLANAFVTDIELDAMGALWVGAWRRAWVYAGYLALLVLALRLVWAAWRRKREREEFYRVELETKVRDRTRQIAERNAELEDANRRLQEASLTDPLTGLANRRALMQALPGLAASCHVERRVPPAPPQIVLMIVDLDCFKPINDRHGHEAGDDVLKRVAALLRDCVRLSDLTVRWGGDEFVVVCSSADLDDGAVLAERIRKRIAKHHFRLGNGATARTSCSIGFVCYPFVRGAPHLLSYEQALNVADTALLEAKTQRNAWIGWSGTPAAHDVADLFTTLDTNAAAVAAKGALRVLSSKYRPDDTVEELIRASRGR